MWHKSNDNSRLVIYLFTTTHRLQLCRCLFRTLSPSVQIRSLLITFFNIIVLALVWIIIYGCIIGNKQSSLYYIISAPKTTRRTNNFIRNWSTIQPLTTRRTLLVAKFCDVKTNCHQNRVYDNSKMYTQNILDAQRVLTI